MLDIKIIAVGKLKDKNLLALAAEFQKRLKPFSKVEIEEVKAEPFIRDSDKEKSRRLEGERIIKILDREKGAYAVALDEGGKEFSSEKFADFLLKKENGRLVFVVGGALGLSLELKKRVDYLLSLSRMTFPHELARVIILEQLWRGVCLIKGKKYHY